MPIPVNKIFVAIDTTDVACACAIITETADFVGGFKFGLEYFSRHAAQGIRQVLSPTAKTGNNDSPLFLDLKFHDIPNTVAAAVRAVFEAGLSPHILTVHTAGGLCMMQAAKHQALESAAKMAIPPPLVIGVTILTALNDTDISQIGYAHTTADQVAKMAQLAKTAGLDGVVCSAYETARIKSICGSDFKTVVPAIRPPWAVQNDQKRTMTPADAIAQGADYLVIGRPITRAQNMATAAQRIANDLL